MHIEKLADNGGVQISLGRTSVLAVTYLATYGAASMTRDGVKAVKEIRARRKAAKLVETPSTPTA